MKNPITALRDKWHAWRHNDEGPRPAPTLKPGEKAGDGSVFVGVSPVNGREMYTTAGDAPLALKFRAAKKYARSIQACGHDDWVVPKMAELAAIYKNREAIGGFGAASAASPSNSYWSSEKFESWGGKCVSFGLNHEGFDGRSVPLSVRPIRYGP